MSETARVAVVTGASRGVGMGVALALGAVTALEVGVELDPARARDALLRLLRPA